MSLEDRPTAAKQQWEEQSYWYKADFAIDEAARAASMLLSHINKYKADQLNKELREGRDIDHATEQERRAAELKAAEQAETPLPSPLSNRAGVPGQAMPMPITIRFREQNDK